jgi:anti-sigma factor ChrR (cupin superfamily)
MPSLLAAQASSGPLRWDHSDAGLTWAPCPPLFPKGCEVSVLHGDPASGPSDIFLRVTPNYSFPAHTHTSAEHILLVSGVMHVTYAGNKMYELKEGTYSLVPAKAGHKAHCAPGKQCVLFIHFDSPIDAAPATDVP